MNRGFIVCFDFGKVLICVRVFGWFWIDGKDGWRGC